MPYRRRGGRKTGLSKALGADRKARAYNRPAKVASVANLAKQVKRMKTQIRREFEIKKWDTAAVQTGSIGQVNGNVTGAVGVDLNLCAMPSGLGNGERVGEKITLKGFQLRLQMVQQSAAAPANNFYVEIWRTTDFTATSTAITYLYEVDSISGVIDYNSSINKDYAGKKNGYKSLYQMVARKRIYIKEDTVSSISQFKNIKVFVKQNQELMYSGGVSQNPNNVRYFMVIRAANGNASSTTASTVTGIPIAAVNTGAGYYASTTAWYVDN